MDRVVIVHLKKLKIKHRVELVITKECSDKPMTNEEMESWIKKQFEGCEYGTVKVTEVITYD